MQKEELEKIYGEVLSTDEATQKYEFIAFCAPFVEVQRKSRRKARHIRISSESPILF